VVAVLPFTFAVAAGFAGAAFCGTGFAGAALAGAAFAGLTATFAGFVGAAFFLATGLVTVFFVTAFTGRDEDFLLLGLTTFFVATTFFNALVVGFFFAAVFAFTGPFATGFFTPFFTIFFTAFAFVGLPGFAAFLGAAALLTAEGLPALPFGDLPLLAATAGFRAGDFFLAMFTFNWGGAPR